MSDAFTIIDIVETYFDSQAGILQRELRKRRYQLEVKGEETLPPETGTVFKLAARRILSRRIQSKMLTLARAWKSAKVVRTQEKLTFSFGILSLLSSALMLGLAPEWVHITYTVLGCCILPLRLYTSKQRAWNYLLLDLCDYITVLNFVYIWFLPSSTALFVACYSLSHGSLASGVVTWRNSLVFHDQEKIMSFFLHMYGPFTFTAIRHFYPSAQVRFPALLLLPHLHPTRALLLTGSIHLIWQIISWKFFFRCGAKIISGKPVPAFAFLLHEYPGVIRQSLASISPGYREATLMSGQLLYSVLTQIPAVYGLYDSALWSGVFLLLILAVSAWNGGRFNFETFGHQFESRLEDLTRAIVEE